MLINQIVYFWGKALLDVFYTGGQGRLYIYILDYLQHNLHTTHDLSSLTTMGLRAGTEQAHNAIGVLLNSDDSGR